MLGRRRRSLLLLQLGDLAQRPPRAEEVGLGSALGTVLGASRGGEVSLFLLCVGKQHTACRSEGPGDVPGSPLPVPWACLPLAVFGWKI